MQIQQQNRAAIYCRLSRDDVLAGDNDSIQTQKQMLTHYAKTKGFCIAGVYTDDGFTGTNFERPGFCDMENDIDSGKIDIVLTKDLSRLGRNYLETGMKMEDFEDGNIRYIAVDDNVDTINGIDDFTPFRNIMNEWYAKDVSKKVRSAYLQKARNGDFTASFAPYGYQKSEHDKHKLVPDEKVAHVIKRIFSMAVNGYSPYKISMTLRAEQILTPRAYTAQQYKRYETVFNPKHPFDWSNSTIMSILRNRVYLGHMVGNKTTTKSYKNKKLVPVSSENWIEVQNTHEPLVDDDTFELAGRVLNVKKRPTADGEHQIFAGLLKCSTCGQSLSYAKEAKRNGKGSFACNQSRRKGKEYCSFHYISYSALYEILLDDIRRNADFAKDREKEFVDMVANIKKSKQKKQLSSAKKERDKLQKRAEELQAVLKKLYEDNALHRISDEQYSALSLGFASEKAQVTARLSELESELAQSEEQKENTEKFTQLVREYTDIQELSKPILNELVEKVVVHDAETVDGKRVQKVDIYYRFIGMLSEQE